jgi:hypothetical protein
MTFGRRMRTLRRRLGLIFALALAVTAVGATASAQTIVRTDEPPRPADDEFKAALIDSVTATLNEDYVFEDVARNMEKHVRKELRKGAYDEYTTIPDFARALTEDLQEISHDRHLGVRYASDEEIRAFLEEDEDPDLDREREIEAQRRENFQFKKIEILPGNVGYLKFNAFVDAPLSGPTATAAMSFLANTDALIIDLRENGGGSPSLIQFITAYFLDETTHLNSFHTRQGDSVHQFWSLPYVPGPKMVDADLYVLTSGYTFSGAEEFTYNLKNLERATIVGETTGGGAHPITLAVWPSLNAGMRVPYARAVNPISGTNWEGTGIEPHIAVPQEQAFDRAYLEALTKLREGEDDEDRAFTLDWAMEGLRAKLEPVEVDAATLESYAGEYGPRRLWVEDGALHYQREDGPTRRALPMNETLFRFEDLDYFRLEVVLDDAGAPIKLVGHYNNGHTDESPRSDS